jgi:hypothetical protein
MKRLLTVCQKEVPGGIIEGLKGRIGMGTKGKIIAVLMGESKNALSGLSPEEGKEGRSAPNYVGIVPLQKRIARHSDTIDGRDVAFHVKGYAPDIITV